MIRERKELGVGTTELMASGSFDSFDPLKHEVVQDKQTGLWSVFHKRRANGDRKLRRAITRESSEPYANATRARDRRALVLTLVPNPKGELVAMRLKGTRRTFYMDWNELYRTMLWRYALTAKAEKRKARDARRKARRDARKAARR